MTWSGKVAQLVAAVGSKLNDLNLIPRTHVVGGRELTPAYDSLASTFNKQNV